ncbi:MAG TPA: sulfatase/phosphatase domain-containing protein, partial [Pirellulales bacterium]|nr:sulfatase/phosphatase domain-containing protein [Pirellulales bacterium]
APGRIDSTDVGKVNDTAIIAAIDLVPSLLRLAGLDASELPADGEDCFDALFANDPTGRRGMLFWRRPPDRPPKADATTCADLAVREGRWKLLCDYDGTRVELYDLDNDPVESTNVAGQHADVAKRLTSAVVAWHRSLPPDNGPGYDAK